MAKSNNMAVTDYGMVRVAAVVPQVNVADVEALAARLGVKELGVEDFKAAGLAGKNDLVKVLGNGEIKAAVNVTAHGFSKSAIAKIEAAGGKAVVIE